MSEEMKRMYETSGEIDEATSVSITLCNLWLPKERIRIYVYCAVMTAIALFLMYMGSEHALHLLIMILVLTGLFIYLPLAAKKNAMVQFQEAAPNGKLAYTSSFSENKLFLTNHTNGGSGELQLSQIKKLFEVDGVWALGSKGGLMYPVFAAQLTETDRELLLALLKQNNPKIKIQLPKKR